LDNNIPLMLNYIDGNDKNKLQDNIELLCYNCFFLYVNNPFGCRKSFKVDTTQDIHIEVKSEDNTP